MEEDVVCRRDGHLVRTCEDQLHRSCSPCAVLRDAYLELQGHVLEVCEIDYVAELHAVAGEATVPVACPVLEREGTVVPCTVSGHVCVAEEEVVAGERVLVSLYLHRVPAVVAEHNVCDGVRRVEVEEDAALVVELEVASCRAVLCLHFDEACRSVSRYGEAYLCHRDAGDVLAREDIVVGELYGERIVGIVEEVVALDDTFFAGFRLLVLHREHRRRIDEYLEVVCHGVVGCSDHIDFVRHYVGYVLRHGQQDGVVGHVARVEHGGTVVEVHRHDAAEVVADDADRCVLKGSGEERILACGVSKAYV